MRVYKEPKTRRWYVDYFFGGRRISHTVTDCGCSVGERLQTPTPALP